VNLTDGVDGLSSSVTIPVMVFFAAAAVKLGKFELALLPASLVGGLIAYLFYNWHPAKVFMGDTGSLFLGGVVCALAFALDMPMILLLVGLVYIVETLSVILQVGYFKLTHGKRLFKMAPIHHHFEMCGWKEVKIVLVFSAVSAIMCLLAWFAVTGF
jgi:phospho-N-acetylmuramoyl-pentapeptide-transferase